MQSPQVKSYCLGTFQSRATGSFTTSGVNNSMLLLLWTLSINRGTFKLVEHIFGISEAELTIINESASSFILSDLNSGTGVIRR